MEDQKYFMSYDSAIIKKPNLLERVKLFFTLKKYKSIDETTGYVTVWKKLDGKLYLVDEQKLETK